MSRQIQIRRGTKTQHASFTGAIGEVTMDTTNNTLRVHDGKTVGGNEMLSRQGLYSNMTNCITEIPQDIKLELKDGVLTLKAGSKVYRPNGVGNFDVIDITTDKTFVYNANRQGFLYMQDNGALALSDSLQNCVSGDTDLKADQTYHVWYDTANNIIKRYTTDTTKHAHTCSLPLGIITVSGGNISSIDVVFNGFGYIGSLVFVLPGVKGLLSNGFNDDGTFKNDVFSYTKPSVAILNNDSYVACAGYNLIAMRANYYRIDTLQEMKDISKTGFYYIKDENVVYSWAGGGATMYAGFVPCVKVKFANNRIISLIQTGVFRMSDSQDTEQIVSHVMPSSRYIDMTLGGSGSSYIMPSDGWLNLVKVSGGVEYISAEGRLQQTAFSGGTGQTMSIFMPVAQGEKVMIYYNASGTTQKFRLVYANGTK